jgi:hypothetical protein
LHVETLNRNAVAGLGRYRAGVLAHRQIGEEGCVAPRVLLHGLRPMIDEMADGNPVREFGGVSRVVCVVVRDHHII